MNSQILNILLMVLLNLTIQPLVFEAVQAQPSYFLADQIKHNKVMGFFEQQKLAANETMYKGLADFLFPQRKRNPKKKIQEPLVQPNQPYYFLKDKRKHKKIIKFLEEQNLMLTPGNYTLVESSMFKPRKFTKDPNKKYGRPKKIKPIPQPIVQTANIKIVVKYEFKVFHGRKFVKSVIDEAEDYAVIKYSNQNQLDQGINHAFAELIRKIQETAESGYVEMIILEKKYYFVSENQLNAIAKDPTLIPMKKAMPISYKFISGIG
jgi:hypothetical protein